MNTTSLFVELLIIGVAAFIWAALLILTLFGYEWIQEDRLFSMLTILPGITIIYVLGIVTDRAADAFFETWFQGEERDMEYYKSRQIVFTRSDRLSDILEYGRSRLRICRGWAFNSVFIFITLNSFVWIRLQADTPRNAISLFGSVAIILLAYACWLAWKKLDRAEFQRSKANAEFLLNDTQPEK